MAKAAFGFSGLEIITRRSSWQNDPQQDADAYHQFDEAESGGVAGRLLGDRLCYYLSRYNQKKIKR